MNSRKEHIYTLEDRSASDISPLWQVVQIFLFIFCIGLGITVCFSFGQVMIESQHNCVLFANVTLVHHDEDLLPSANKIHPSSMYSVNQTIKPGYISVLESTFYNVYCDVVLYVPIAMSAFACFFMVMFVYCGRGGAGSPSTPEAWRIVLPTVFFNAACFISAFVVGVTFFNGLSDFLRSVAKALNISKLNLHDITNLYVGNKNIAPSLKSNLTISKHCMWMLITFWGLNFSWILLRCLFNVDFQLVRTTILVIPKDQTRVQRSAGRAYGKNPEKEQSPTPTSENIVRQRTVRFTPSTIVAPALRLTHDMGTEISPSFAGLHPHLSENEEDADAVDTDGEETTRHDLTMPPQDSSEEEDGGILHRMKSAIASFVSLRNTRVVEENANQNKSSPASLESVELQKPSDDEDDGNTSK